jgi:hypothetical protein
MSVQRHVSKNVARADYLRDAHAEPPYSRKHGSGAQFLLRTQIEGVDQSKLSLVAYVYSEVSDQPVLQFVERDAPIFRSGASTSNQFGKAWVPYPTSGGDYYVRFELYADKALIAYANSPNLHLRG